MVLEQHNLYLANEDCEDDDLHDDGFDEDLALVEVWVWHGDHDDVDQDDGLDDGVLDAPHSYDGMEEAQLVQLACHGKDQHGPQPEGHQGEEECHYSLHCSL